MARDLWSTSQFLNGCPIEAPCSRVGLLLAEFRNNPGRWNDGRTVNACRLFVEFSVCPRHDRNTLLMSG